MRIVFLDRGSIGPSVELHRPSFDHDWVVYDQTAPEQVAERLAVSGWLSFAKLVLHPLFVAGGVYLLFPVPPFQAAVAVATASLPVAGNVYMLAQHYGIAPQRVSAAILISTAFSIVTVSTVIALVNP